MANRAYINDVVFSVDAVTPNVVRVAATVIYSDGTTTGDSELIDEGFPQSASVTDITDALIGAAVAQAPAGFTVSAEDVVVANLISG
jgi:hypothetical protein